MPDLNKIIEDLSSLTVAEAADLSKQLEEKWGVSAAAAVAAAPAAAGAAAAIGVTPHFSSNCFESSAASATVKLERSSIILFRSGIIYSLGCVSEFSAGKLLIFSDRASKILTNFDAEAFKIPTIFALASSNVGKFATFNTPA